MFVSLYLAPGAARGRFRRGVEAAAQPHRGTASGRNGRSRGLLDDRSRLTVWNLASLASSLVGVAALAAGGLVTVAFVF